MNGLPFTESATYHLIEIDKTNGALCALGQLLNAADVERLDFDCFMSSLGDLLEVLGTTSFGQTDRLRKLIHRPPSPSP